MKTDSRFRLRVIRTRASTQAYEHILPSVYERYRTEPELRHALVHRLLSSGIVLEASVPCAAGSADLVTPMRDIIIEVKHHLTRSALFQAIGQLLVYRQSFNPAARMLVVGYATVQTHALMPHAAAVGVEICCWHDTVSGDEQLNISGTELAGAGTQVQMRQGITKEAEDDTVSDMVIRDTEGNDNL